MRRFLTILLILALILSLGACMKIQKIEPTPTPEPTAAPTPEPTAAPTPEPT